MSVLLDTSHGPIVIDLFTDICPKACLNFLALCHCKYYNNSLFFNVQKDFYIQSGDPEKQDGSGGESIWHYAWKMSKDAKSQQQQQQDNSIENKSIDNLNDSNSNNNEPSNYFPVEIHPKIRFLKEGLVAMAGGPNFQSSQFFITTSNTHLKSLDGTCTIFGEVAEGMDIVKAIENIPVRDKTNRPLQAIRIRHTSILFNPLSQEMEILLPFGWSKNPPASPEPIKLFSDMLPEDTEITSEFNGLSNEEIEKKIKENNLKSQLLFLQLSGYLPDENLKPPENVLFVCRLNPKTNDKGLELVFSQFGTILKCNIVKDKEGVSLGYGFIEFETKEICERAYTKMQNVLIDDRRIVVDFAQSVSQIYNKWNKGYRGPIDNYDPESRSTKRKRESDKFDRFDNRYEIEDRNRVSNGRYDNNINERKDSRNFNYHNDRDDSNRYIRDRRGRNSNYRSNQRFDRRDERNSQRYDDDYERRKRFKYEDSKR